MKLALLLLSAVSLSAQVPVLLEIVAPANRVTAGDTLQLTAIGVASNGDPVTQAPVWTVDQSAIASIDSTGKLLGKTLGIVKITAASGKLTHDVEIQVIPDHTTISPTAAELTIGGTMQFTATAFDRKGNALPNVNWSWTIVSTMDDGTPSVPYGRISSTGMLTAAYEGPSYVRALYSYSGPSGVISGMENRIALYAPFLSSAPRPYKVTRLANASTQPRQNPTLRTRPSLLSSTPDGKLLFNASLDGVSTALLAWDGTTFQPVVAAGGPSNTAASLVNDLRNHAVAADGQILTNESTTDGNRVQKGFPGNLRPLLVSNTSAPNAESLGGFNVTRNSLASSSDFVFTASYRVPGTSTYGSALFRGYGSQVNEILFSQLETVPELGVAGVTAGDFGIDSNGVAWYTANLPGKTTLFRHDGQTRQKFLTVGDPLLGSTLKGFFGGRNSTSAYLFADNGDVIFGVSLNDGRNMLLRYSGADPAQPAQTLRVDNTTVPLSWQADGGVLIYGNPNPNKGDGVWLWKDGNVTPIALINKALINGQPMLSVDSGTLDSQGRITLIASTAATTLAVVRVSATAAPGALFQAGDTIPVAVPSLFTGFSLYGRSGSPVLLSGSITNASLAEWRDGVAQPLLSVGDKVLGSTAYPGANPYGTTQRTANGDFYAILPNVGVARFAANGDRKWGTALAFPIKLSDGATATLPYRIAVNNTGAIVWTAGTDKGDTRVYLSQNGTHQILCANGLFLKEGATIAGQAIYSCDDYFLDDSNRVLMRVHVQDRVDQRSFVWNAGTWQLAVQYGTTKIGGRNVTNTNAFRPAGTHLFAALQTDAGTSLAEWTDTGWNAFFEPADKLPTGFYLNNVSSFLEGSSQGDLVFIAQAYPSFGVYARRGGQVSTVLTTGRRTEDGDYLVTILGMDIRDDGAIYLLALNERDELVLYGAVPN